jgi:hypothetical protein
MDKRLRFMTDLIAPLKVPPGNEVRLSRDHDPGYTGEVARPQAAALLADGVELLADYQDRLAAQDTFGVLLVLQGLDASGKDSTIKHVMSGVNPQAVEVRAFKQPSAEELNHDFLWRYQCALPGRGRIGIFNRVRGGGPGRAAGRGGPGPRGDPQPGGGPPGVRQARGAPGRDAHPPTAAPARGAAPALGE